MQLKNVSIIVFQVVPAVSAQETATKECLLSLPQTVHHSLLFAAHSGGKTT